MQCAVGTQAYVSGSPGSKCLCCPYGYHIDLDFVRYCEAVAAGSVGDRSVERRKKRERRRQCQSMEVLLGLVIDRFISRLNYPVLIPTPFDSSHATSISNYLKMHIAPFSLRSTIESIVEIYFLFHRVSNETTPHYIRQKFNDARARKNTNDRRNKRR